MEGGLCGFRNRHDGIFYGHVVAARLQKRDSSEEQALAIAVTPAEPHRPSAKSLLLPLSNQSLPPMRQPPLQIPQKQRLKLQNARRRNAL